MKTFQEENAITYRIDKMRRLWRCKVKKTVQFVKWSVKKDEIRMVQAFCMLEGSEHGKLLEYFLNFQIPFSDKEHYAADLTWFWLRLWEDPKARKEVEHSDKLPNWDDTPFKDIPGENTISHFLECMSSFTASIVEHATLVLNVMPTSFDGNPDFADWVYQCAQQAPDNLKLLVYDTKAYPVFDNVPPILAGVTLAPDLQMHAAMREMLTAGSMGSGSAVDFNRCMFNMADAMNANDLDGVHQWGKEAVGFGKKLKNKGLEATAYLAYGSGLLQLRKSNDALDQYQKAEKISQEGVAENDPMAPTLLLQSYHFQAALYHIKKKRKCAVDYYRKTANEALSQDNLMMYLESSRLGAKMLRKTGDGKAAYSWLKKAFEAGRKLPGETQKFSSMLLVCHDLEAFAEQRQDTDLTVIIHQHATSIWGEEWRKTGKRSHYMNTLTT